jgi:O-antigen ligase
MPLEPATMTRLQERFDIAAKWALVGVFLSFPVALGLANTLSAVVVLCWLAAGHYRQRWQAIRHNPMVLPALLLFGLILLGTLYSTGDMAHIRLHTLKYSKLLIALVFLSLLDQARWRRYCLGAFAAAMLFILASVYASIWIRLPWISLRANPAQALGWGVDHTVVGDYITQNVMMSFFAVLCLTLCIASQKNRWRGLWLALAGLAVLSITNLSQGRTGYFVLAACLLTFVLTAIPGRGRYATLLLLATVLAAGLLSSRTMEARFQTAWVEIKNHNTDIHSSVGHRLYNYKTVLELIRERPVQGWGTGSYDHESCRMIVNPVECVEFGWHPHNQYLFFWLENGLPGLLAYLFLIFRLVSYGRAAAAPDRFLILGLACALIADSLTNSPLFSARENHFFLFMMALLMAGPELQGAGKLSARPCPSGWRRHSAAPRSGKNIRAR